MGQILNHIDAYGIFATILSMILAIVVPILSFKYRKLIHILQECRILLSAVVNALQDEKITEEELKEIIGKAKHLIQAIKEN